LSSAKVFEENTVEKLIYLLQDCAAGAPQLRDRLLGETAPALRAHGARDITLHIADLNEPVRQASPGRIAGAWDRLGGAVHFWLDNLDRRGAIEQQLAGLCGQLQGYLVTESVVQDCERSWRDGERRPGVTQFSAHGKPANVSEEEFYHNWQVLHSATSFALHPRRWSYVRNAVARPLTPNAPAQRVIVLEHFRELADFTDESRYFGGPEVVEAMYAELPGFCDFDSMVTGPMSEYAFD
jgi:hypothetical protein